MSDVVLTETVGAVRRITMNRPEKLNAMNPALVEAMIASLRAADEDDQVAVIVLAGAGRASALERRSQNRPMLRRPPRARSWRRAIALYVCTSN